MGVRQLTVTSWASAASFYLLSLAAGSKAAEQVWQFYTALLLECLSPSPANVHATGLAQRLAASSYLCHFSSAVPSERLSQKECVLSIPGLPCLNNCQLAWEKYMCVGMRQAGPTGPGISFNRMFVSGLVGNSSASAWETSVFGELFCGVCSDLGSIQKMSHDLRRAVLMISVSFVHL